MPAPRRYVALLFPAALLVLAAPALASATVPLPPLLPPDVHSQRVFTRPTPTPRPATPEPLEAAPSNDWSPRGELNRPTSPPASGLTPARGPSVTRDNLNSLQAPPSGVKPKQPAAPQPTSTPKPVETPPPVVQPPVVQPPNPPSAPVLAPPSLAPDR